MKPLKNKSKYLVFFAISILLLIPTIYLLTKNVLEQKIITQRPTEVIVANISTVEAQIYWKAKSCQTIDCFWKARGKCNVLEKCAC